MAFWGSGANTADGAWQLYGRYMDSTGDTATGTNNNYAGDNWGIGQGSGSISFGPGGVTVTPSSSGNKVTNSNFSGGGATADDILKALMAAETKKYAEGGVATESALAYLHAGERVLSPTQTRLFERLVESISQPMMVSMPSMPSFPALTGGGSTMFSVENINVNVAKLIDDQDYDEVVD